MSDKTTDELVSVVCNAMDAYRLVHCETLTVIQILTALERIRHGLTERVLQHQKIKT